MFYFKWNITEEVYIILQKKFVFSDEMNIASWTILQKNVRIYAKLKSDEQNSLHALKPLKKAN